MALRRTVMALWYRAGRTAAERAEVARIRGAADLFATIGREIEAYCLPLDEIAATLPPTLSIACPITQGNMTEALLAAAAQMRDASAAAVLSRTAARLGRGGREDQVNLCRSAAQNLGKTRDLLTEQAERDHRGRRTLCLTACLLVIILLW